MTAPVDSSFYADPKGLSALKLDAKTQSPESLRVTVGPGASRDGTIRLWLGRDYVEGVDLIRVDPEPMAVEVGSRRFTYTFLVSDVAQPVTLRFCVEARKFGRRPVVLGVEEASRVEFTQFVYP